MSDLLKGNPLLVVVILAVIAALLIILTGHAADGDKTLSALYTLMALAGGGHLAAIVPGLQSSTGNGDASPPKQSAP